ncbi:hypothetical protein [Rhodopseudomonas palustris]|uniref:hypothetical protein n=1 Tax=Rhodopseudomonas palustris TaxID=1076 RepID=UPI003D9A2BDD
MTADQFRATDPPKSFCCLAEEADVTAIIDDDGGVPRVVERDLPQRLIVKGTVVSAHRPDRILWKLRGWSAATGGGRC